MRTHLSIRLKYIFFYKLLEFVPSVNFTNVQNKNIDTKSIFFHFLYIKYNGN